MTSHFLPDRQWGSSLSANIHPQSTATSHLGLALPQYSFQENSPLDFFTPQSGGSQGYSWQQPPWIDSQAPAGHLHQAPRPNSPFLFSSLAHNANTLMQGPSSHTSLFNTAELDSLDHWFDALKEDSLLGTVAQWQDNPPTQEIRKSRKQSSSSSSASLSPVVSQRPASSSQGAYRANESELQARDLGPDTQEIRAPTAKRQRMQQHVPHASGSSSAQTPSTEHLPKLSHSVSSATETNSESARSTPPHAQAQASAQQSAEDRKAKQPLTSQQKRLNHIESEKRRRETIKTAFGALVTTLQDAHILQGQSEGKGKPRGRGRKGEGCGGATKNVVLAKAVEHVKALKEGNDALKEELQALEASAV